MQVVEQDRRYGNMRVEDAGYLFRQLNRNLLSAGKPLKIQIAKKHPGRMTGVKFLQCYDTERVREVTISDQPGTHCQPTLSA